MDLTINPLFSSYYLVSLMRNCGYTETHLDNVGQMIAIARGQPEKSLKCPSESYAILSEILSIILDFKRKLPFDKLVSILRIWGSLALIMGGRAMLSIELPIISTGRRTLEFPC